MLLSRLLALSLLTPLLAPAALADVVNLEPAKDATIYNDTVGNRSDGQGSTMYSGRAGTNTSWPVRRCMVAFDVASAVPAGSTVQSVQLKLYMSQTVVGAKTFDIHRLTTAWNEGPSVGQSGNGAPAQVGDSTWLYTYWNTQSWTTPGGDFVATPSASTSVGSSYQYYFWGSTAAMVADVQAWVNNSSVNHGWIVRGPETGLKSAKQFESSESLAQYRPILSITFTPPAPTAYCTAKTNSLGCVPAISSTGTPDANAGSGFVISMANGVSNKSGLLFYGTTGPHSAPFQGGYLCVQAPLKRTAIQNSGGNPPPDDCSGTFSFDFNVRIASGFDPALVAGAWAWAQYWSRDPNATYTTNLSDALAFVIQP
jgi:hypothetical protein